MPQKIQDLEKVLKYMESFSPEFLQKVSDILSLRVPFLTEALGTPEASVIKALVDFMQAQDTIERWLKVDAEKGFTAPQNRDNASLKETDLDHVIVMLGMAECIFQTGFPYLAATLQKETVLNGIFVHDGGENGDVGDVTHADEKKWIESHDEQKMAEHFNLISFWENKIRVKKIKEKLGEEVFRPYFEEEFRLTKEGSFIKFLDRFQALQFGFEHIYPYESVYHEKKKIEEYLAKYFIDQIYQVMKLLPLPAQQDLKKFITHNFTLVQITLSYKKAVLSGSLTQETAASLLSRIQGMIDILYKADSTAVFLKDWEMLRNTDEFLYVHIVEGF